MLSALAMSFLYKKICRALLVFLFLSVIVIVSAVDMSGNTALIAVFRPISLISYLSLKLVFNLTFIALSSSILSHLWVEFIVLSQFRMSFFFGYFPLNLFI